jgi:hypothetical protein
VTRSATRISNPGCYATNTQMLLAPLLPLIDVKNPPTIFGISGYSGAGTKTGSNDEHGRPQTVPKIVSRGSRWISSAITRPDERSSPCRLARISEEVSDLMR